VPELSSNHRPEQPVSSSSLTLQAPVKLFFPYSIPQVPDLFPILQKEVVTCRRCPRLTEYTARIAQVKRRAYRDWEYWGRPVPSFGDPAAAVLILGLAPGAHGSNRTGRMFTGDRSGDILYRVLHKAGFASQASSGDRDDGLTLTGAYITAVCHCAPPANKPLPEEIRNCRPYFERELDLLPSLRVVVALGKIAFDNYLDILKSRGLIRSRAPYVFGHDRQFSIAPGQPILVSSYHPSQQNTSTGKLNEKMLLAVFRRARKLAATG
jgi:uracil-DNA glycosylase family 4